MTRVERTTIVLSPGKVSTKRPINLGARQLNGVSRHLHTCNSVCRMLHVRGGLLIAWRLKVKNK